MLYNFIDSTINELLTRDESQEQWLKFLSHTAYFDKKTEQSFAILNERMYNILTVEDQTRFKDFVDQVDVERQFAIEVDRTVTFFKKPDVQS